MSRLGSVATVTGVELPRRRTTRSKRRKARRAPSYIGRRIARDVTCCRCADTIATGSEAYKNASYLDSPEWICGGCI